MDDCCDADCAIRRLGVKYMVDEFQHMRRLSGSRLLPDHQHVCMSQHEGRKNMPIAGCQAVDVVTIEAFALQAVVEKILVDLQMAGVGGVYRLYLADGVAKAFGGQLFLSHQFRGQPRAPCQGQRGCKLRPLAGRGGRRLLRTASGPGLRGRARGCPAKWLPLDPYAP